MTHRPSRSLRTTAPTRPHSTGHAATTASPNTAFGCPNATAGTATTASAVAPRRPSGPFRPSPGRDDEDRERRRHQRDAEQVRPQRAVGHQRPGERAEPDGEQRGGQRRPGRPAGEQAHEQQLRGRPRDEGDRQRRHVRRRDDAGAAGVRGDQRHRRVPARRVERGRVDQPAERRRGRVAGGQDPGDGVVVEARVERLRDRVRPAHPGHRRGQPDPGRADGPGDRGQRDPAAVALPAADERPAVPAHAERGARRPAVS